MAETRSAKPPAIDVDLHRPACLFTRYLLDYLRVTSVHAAQNRCIATVQTWAREWAFTWHGYVTN